MQTFLPFADFQQSADVLDIVRLRNQRRECKQIYLALRDGVSKYRNHPAVLMWKDNINSLIEYSMIISSTAANRRTNDNMYDWFDDQRYRHVDENFAKPWWLGREELHLSHRVNLYTKDPYYYVAFKSEIYVPYWWPTHVTA